MSKIATIIILGQLYGILNLKNNMMNLLKTATVREDLLKIAKKHEICVDHQNNNLRLNQVSIHIYFKFPCKISKTQS